MMYQEIETTHQEKVDMYMKLKKRQLVEMLIECNRLLHLQSFSGKQYPNPYIFTDYNDKAEDCLHNTCTDCNGTGIRKDGGICIHGISCPCPICTPRC